MSFPFLLVVIEFVGIPLFVWLLFAWFWLRQELRHRVLTRRFPGAVFVDVVVNGPLASELRRLNVLLTGAPMHIWPTGYITVVATPDGLQFFSRVFVPRQLCAMPAHLIATVGIRVIDFPTRTVTRQFPAIFVSLRASAQGVAFGMLPLRNQLAVARKLTRPQLEKSVDDLVARLGLVIDSVG